MHETQRHAKPPSSATTALRAKKRKFSRKAIAATLAVVAALVAIPAVGIANTFAVDYSWYKNATGSTYVIETPGQWNAFANLVNGAADEAQAGVTTDSFAGKTVELGGDLNFMAQDVVPVGGQGGHTFDGTFDGKGHAIDNVTINAQGATANVGLIGAAGEDSAIENVNVGSKVSLTIAETDNTKAIENVGLLVGSSQGSISSVTNAGTLTVSHSMDQTKAIVFPIKNVGGVAGICTGNIFSVKNAGTVSVSEPGVPYKAGASETDWDDQSILAINIGGVVGSAGDVDTSVDSTSAAAHDVVLNCENTGNIKVDTPKTNGIDRFGNTVCSQSSNVGGIAGYSRSSISSCTNSGYLEAPHAAGMGGIVGSLRAKTTGSSYSGNFTSEGSDDGMVSGAEALEVMDCTNSGSVYGYSFPAGIVGRAGTYTQIRSCLNESDATILGSRSTKPFPAGIVGSSYGTVSYCGNLGRVVAGSWTGLNGTISQSGGYFASGIAGNLSSFTKNVDGEQVNASGVPELYGCYNAGPIQANDNMRQRALVGDNGGYVHDNVAVAGLVYNDRLVYGMYADDTETSGGTVYNNVLLSSADFKANAAYDPSKQDSVSSYNPNTTNAIAVLNSSASKDGWATFWTKSNGTVNGGNPVLNTQVTWDATDLSSATVEFAANAQYTGLDAVPYAKVTLAGKELQQDVDFRVIPQDGATEVTAAGQKPYTATVVGIGSYSGEAGQFAYGIDKGDLANCTVTIDMKTYNWTAQTPSASGVHVYNLAGKEVAADQYTFALDQTDKNLSFVDADGYATEQDTGVKGAVNAKKYNVKVTATADSAYFTGTTDATFSIKTAKIVCDKDAEKQQQNAYPTSVSYDGNIISMPKTTDTADNIAWDSMTLRADLPADQQDDGLLTVSYTGTNIKPTINDVVYKGKSLTLGKDYRVVYGASLNEGQVVNPGEENLGKAGGEDYGYVIARYVSGGNFSNYDNMKFKIVDEGKDLDIADAQVKGTDDIVFEQGGVYEPITVWYGGSQLTEGTDYTIAYVNNDKLGTATYTITGMGRYTGTKTGSFKLVEGVPYELQYAYNADGTASVTGVEYKGALNTFDLVIPATVEKDGATYTVTAIADKAFGGNGSDLSGSVVNESKQRIASVSIPATVKSLGSYAFGTSANDPAMKQLKSVTFAEGSQLETIGDNAFQQTGVSDITIPAGVKSVGKKAFTGNNGTLKTVTFLGESASAPVLVTSPQSNSPFFGVYNVTAKAYDGTAAATFAQGMVASNQWKFDSMGSVPAKSEFTVSFDALGGTPVPAAQTVAKGAAATKPAVDPTRDGAAFAGWFESADGGKTLAASAYDFATPVNADKTLYAKWETAEPAALTVEVYQADGKTLEKTVSFTSDELAAMATTDGEPALGQYYKGSTWSVYRSTDYITYDDLFANAGVTVGKYDTVQASGGGSDGPSLTLAYMNGGKWYPNAAADGSLGEAADGSQPAGLALSYQLGSGATASKALAAAEAADVATANAPLQIMGVGSDGNVAGKRFSKQVDTVKVVRDAATALTVEVQDAGGNVTDTKDVTAAQLNAMATTDGEPAIGQYCKDGTWSVYRSENYVAYGDLFANLGLSVGDGDEVTAWQGGSAGKFTGVFGQMKAGAWCPNAVPNSDGRTFSPGQAAQTLPAGLALSYQSGSGETPADALAAAAAAQATDSGAPLQIMGAYDGATAGNRFWTGVDKVVVRQMPVVTVSGVGGTYSYVLGSVKATAVAQQTSGLTDVSYQWYSVGGALSTQALGRVAGTPIEGATSATYELPAGKDAGTYTVYCVVSGSDKDGNAVSATSEPVDLVVAKGANAIAWAGEGYDASSNSVTVTAAVEPTVAADGGVNATVRYAISASAAASADTLTWQDSATFTGLDADATYYVYAKVSGLKNYEDAVSAGLKVATKAEGAVANPVLDGVTYDPAATLANVTLPEGWAWADLTVVPTVKVGAYAAIFTPTADQLASADYSEVEGWDAASQTVKRQVALAVSKATPTITAVPSASSLTFGQTLAESTLTGGAASVDGTFTWADAQRAPQVAESGKAVMEVTFAPADSDNYNTVSTNVAVTVTPKDLTQGVVTITVPGQTYTGAAVEPALTIVYNGVVLVAGTDYDVAYSNNVEVGTAAYAVTFKGNYAGTASGTFDIAKAPEPAVPGDGADGNGGDNGNGGDGGEDNGGNNGNGAGATNGGNTAATGASAAAAGNAAALAPTADAAGMAAVAALAIAAVAAAGIALARRRMSR